MLLDEADVLLCRRKSSEMDRNAVVAVFLRKIEYLQGVLFLTTNRHADFDDAFKSRIHLTVSYPDLSEEAQSVIWKGLIANNKTIEVDDLWDDHVFAVLGKLGLNVRSHSLTSEQQLTKSGPHHSKFPPHRRLLCALAQRGPRRAPRARDYRDGAQGRGLQRF